MHELIISKLKDKSAKIAIIGLGYVGLPLAIRFLEEKFQVYGIDIDSKKISILKKGESYIKHIPVDMIKMSIGNGNFIPSDQFSDINQVDIIIICVPTPLSIYREPDISYITNTIVSISPFLKKGQFLSLESTTYPGTTEEELRPRLEKAGFKIGTDFFLCFSPEREDPGNKKFTTKTIPKIISGSTLNCRNIAAELYSKVVDSVVPVSSTQTAEMTKLLENIHRAVNIGLVNEMKVVADRMGIDIYEVIRTAATKPFGFVSYYPGPGLGGHCIPIDPFYLTWKAREFGLHTRFIELAGEVNSSMPDFVVEKVGLALNDSEKSIKGSKILILGVAYKKNIDDMRESPAIFIIQKLARMGARIDYYDPYIPVVNEHSVNLKGIELSKDLLMSFDCVVLVTDHDSFDYDFIFKYSNLIIDSRGRYQAPSRKIFKA